MKHIIAHYHEIILKGKNRSRFEERLASNIKNKITAVKISNTTHREGRIIVEFEKDLTDQEFLKIKEQLSKIFGITSFLPMETAEPTIESIIKTAEEIFNNAKGSFAIRTKRSNKKFPHTSEKTNALVGKAIQDKFGNPVDLSNPENTLFIEILEKKVYLGMNRFKGLGGLPGGISGKVIAMLSGGIDSPVAAWKLAKRGCEVVFVHFHSYPHTSKASINKVKELAKIISEYQGKSKIYLVPFAEVQREVVMKTIPKYRVLLYRRLMVKIADAIAKKEKALALVTGESVGQVASQTLPNLQVTEDTASLPIFRPLIGEDKEDIINLAKQINTYETSIIPHDDCCTLFIPKNPATGANLEIVKKEEEKLDVKNLIKTAIKNSEIKKI